MPRHGALSHARSFPPSRNVLRTQSRRIEHLFEAGYRTVVQQQRAIPDTAQGWNFVKASSFSRFESKARISSDRDTNDVLSVGVIDWGFISFG